ncbi:MULTISPECIES: hemerythrin domain-containing protein [Alphaproteobacteria]|uniref:hemerythrin domain-containing protein n=1 Tax=Alphaproteobacteria TaxID=28211 RepID=UPI00329A1540
MKHPEPATRGSGKIPTDTGLLDRPLDFLVEDHLRERQICAVIDSLATTATLDRTHVLCVLRFLNEELNVHLRDEVEDLFPLLVARCLPEDAVENAITRVRVDHDEALRLLPDVRASLSTCLDTGSALSQEERKVLTRFAGHVRGHLVAENAILLPIARVRLTRADLRTLSRHMRSRRGLPERPETSDAE